MGGGGDKDLNRRGCGRDGKDGIPSVFLDHSKKFYISSGGFFGHEVVGNPYDCLTTWGGIRM